MSVGILYVMTTAVSGLVKIGKTGTENFKERMRFLEANGYYNVSGLKKFFAIELEDYHDKENLIHEIFNKHRVGTSELFALDQELVRQLLLALEGRVIYPERVDKERQFEEISQIRKQGARFSFYKKGLSDGDAISFLLDESIVATVAGERDVAFKNEIWKLSPLTYKIFEEKNQLNDSGAYQGAAYWAYQGTKLKDLSDVTI